MEQILVVISLIIYLLSFNFYKPNAFCKRSELVFSATFKPQLLLLKTFQINLGHRNDIKYKVEQFSFRKKNSKTSVEFWLERKGRTWWLATKRYEIWMRNKGSQIFLLHTLYRSTFFYPTAPPPSTCWPIYILLPIVFYTHYHLKWGVRVGGGVGTELRPSNNKGEKALRRRRLTLRYSGGGNQLFKEFIW